MQFTVRATELNAVLERIDQVTESFDDDSTYSDTALITLSVRRGELTLKVGDLYSDLYATLTIEQKQDGTTRALTLQRSELKEALGGFAPEESLLFTTDGPLHHSDHEADFLRDLTSGDPQLYVMSENGRCHLSYSHPQFNPYESKHEQITHRLDIPQRALRALLAYCVCCTAPQDPREYLQGPQLKLSMKQPRNLVCNATDGNKLAILTALLPESVKAELDLETILRPQTVRQLLELLDAESEEEAHLEFSTYTCSSKVGNFTLESSLIYRPTRSLRFLVPNQSAGLTVSLPQFTACLHQVHQHSQTPVFLKLLFVDAADLNEDGSVPEQILKGSSRRTGKTPSKAAAPKSSVQGAAAWPGRAKPKFGALFLEYTDSAKRKSALLVESTQYRGKTCRITLSHPEVQAVLKGLSGLDRLLIAFDQDDFRSIIFSPLNTKNTLPIDITYLLPAI
ncbi:MAG: hypothetical protein IJ228_03660 [Succinivibrio sp.]|nr:hypothetical protein [Succinivibrio sp.]